MADDSNAKRRTLRPRKTTLRLCLGGCQREFHSHGNANRICPKCAARNAGLSRREGGASRPSLSIPELGDPTILDLL